MTKPATRAYSAYAPAIRLTEIVLCAQGIGLGGDVVAAEQIVSAPRVRALCDLLVVAAIQPAPHDPRRTQAQVRPAAAAAGRRYRTADDAAARAAGVPPGHLRGWSVGAPMLAGGAAARSPGRVDRRPMQVLEQRAHMGEAFGIEGDVAERHGVLLARPQGIVDQAQQGRQLGGVLVRAAQ